VKGRHMTLSLFFLILLHACGCIVTAEETGILEVNSVRKNSTNVHAGMSSEKVKKILGNPFRIVVGGDGSPRVMIYADMDLNSKAIGAMVAPDYSKGWIEVVFGRDEMADKVISLQDFPPDTIQANEARWNWQR